MTIWQAPRELRTGSFCAYPHRDPYPDPATWRLSRQGLVAALNRLNREFAEWEYGITLRISDDFLNDRLRLDFGTLVDVTNGSGVIRPRATYQFTDWIKLLAGLDYFYGDEQSVFGFLEKNSALFLEEVGFVF